VFANCHAVSRVLMIGLAGALLLPPSPAVAADAPAAPARIIFDTDMGNDIDDALALAMLHALQSRGECRLLAVTLTKNHPLAGPFVDALNTFYGRGEIPIGVRRDGTNGGSRFLKLAAVRDGDRLRYPGDLDPKTAPAAPELLRQVLTAEPDGSVTLVQVGFFSNLARLLETPADVELVRRKVKLLCIMGGSFQVIRSNRHFLEYNVKMEIPAAQKVADEWPTPIVWSGFEIGDALRYPAVSIERDFTYAEHHIIPEAYRLYEPPPHERPMWDPSAVLYAVRPDESYFDLSPPGRVTIAADGFTRFTPGTNGRDRFLVLDAPQIARTREAMVQLVTQPPQSRSNAK
jgi:inosine-uridine nucleoside N-ribohydrolase